MPISQDKPRANGLAMKNRETVVVAYGALRYVGVAFSIDFAVVSVGAKAMKDALSTKRRS